MLFLLSCHSIEYTPRTNYHPLSISTDDKQNRFYAFYPSVPLNFEYEELGVLEIIGNRNQEKPVIFDFFKKAAWKKGANAVINIEHFTLTLPSEFYRGRVEDLDPNDTIPYEVNGYKGMVVNIKITPEFLEAYGKGSDLKFVQEIKLLKEEPSKMYVGKQKTTAAVLTALAAVGIYLFHKIE